MWCGPRKLLNRDRALLSLAQLASSEEVRLLADGLKQKLALYTQEARFYEITQQEKLELSQQAISQEYAAELGAVL